MNRLLTLFLALLGVAMLASCHHSDPIIEEEPAADHTLLIYMAADNNGMAKYCNDNINACIQGLCQAKQPLHLLIFKDTGPHPVLFQLKRNARNKQKVDTLYVKRYDEYVNTSDPAFLAQVVNAAFEACPATVKGFEYWSHGGSWVPDGWSPSKEQTAREATRASQYVGIDNNRYMQLWEFREALEKCPHLDYISFDACNMATAEVAYELRKQCDYILASAQEIMGDGFPYKGMISSLSEAHVAAGVETALRACVDHMQILYPNNGSLSLFKCHEMEAVADAYARLLQDSPDCLAALRENASTIQSGWQHFGGGGATNTIYYYYDLQEVAEYLQGDVSAVVKSAVPYYYTAATYYSRYDGRHAIDRFCGLAVSVPEFFGLCRGNSYLREGYHMTQWGQKMGY